MNVTKFLALKIAEAAIELSDDAEHVADRHTTGDDSPPCSEEFRDSVGRLATLMQIGLDNGVFPDFDSPEHAKALKSTTKAMLFNEAMADACAGRLTLDRLLVL